MAGWNIIQVRSQGAQSPPPVTQNPPPRRQSVPAIAHTNPIPAAPNYPALIEVLMTLRCRPDHMGETYLNEREAAAIRKCGFEALAGYKRPWLCPLIPDRLLWAYPCLQHLSDATEHLWLPRYGGWNPKRARPLPVVTPRDPLSKLDRRFLRILESGPQRRLWRIPATIFRPALNRLIAAGRIVERDGYFVADNKN